MWARIRQAVAKGLSFSLIAVLIKSMFTVDTCSHSYCYFLRSSGYMHVVDANNISSIDVIEYARGY